MRLLIMPLLLMLASPAMAQPPLQAVPELDLARYAGTWHEIARLPMFFQRKCARDVTATYTLAEDGTIGVRNACVKQDGDTMASDGQARRTEHGQGKLEVRFAPAWLSALPMVWADYWVIALDQDYQWAIVGEPGREPVLHHLDRSRADLEARVEIDPRRLLPADHQCGLQLREIHRHGAEVLDAHIDQPLAVRTHLKLLQADLGREHTLGRAARARRQQRDHQEEYEGGQLAHGFTGGNSEVFSISAAARARNAQRGGEVTISSDRS